MTWILIVYLSVGIGTAATGGPAAIEGFSSAAACESAATTIQQRVGRKYDWHLCVEVRK